jgi:hypothetical protein
LLGSGYEPENPCSFWQRPDLNMPVPTGKVCQRQRCNPYLTRRPISRWPPRPTTGTPARLITVTDEGEHGICGGVNRCADRLVNAFLTTDKAPSKDQTCRGEGIPAPTAPEPAEASIGGDPAGGAPLARIASPGKVVSGYIH